jgi:hypothetical protein
VLVWLWCLSQRWESWLWLGPAAAVFVNVVSSSDHLITGHYHYDFASFAAVLICVLEGPDSRARWPWRRWPWG